MLDGPELRGHMYALADELLAMTVLTLGTDEREQDGTAPSLEERAERVVAHLDRIESRALAVGGRDTVTDRPEINAYMDGFLYDVRLAREFARRDPPNFVPANRLVGSCRSCHAELLPP